MFHKDCPLSIKQPLEHLPLKVVEQVLRDLSQISFDKEIGFHTYNEPIIDPRLYYIMLKTRELLPNSPIVIWTNGSILTKSLVSTFNEIGKVRYVISIYNKSDQKRIQEIFPVLRKKFTVDKVLPTVVSKHLFEKDSENVTATNYCDGKILSKRGITKQTMDTRKDIYNHEKINLKKPCHAPYSQVVITYKGDVSLCCYDWKRTVTFGNVKKQSLLKILSGNAMDEAYTALSSGNRIFDICMRCPYSKSIKCKRDDVN